MHGLNPEAIQNFLYLIGGEVEQVSVGKFDLQFRLHPAGHISVWSRCELIAADGRLADAWQAGARSERFLFADLLGATVELVLIENANTLRLEFADGRQLAIYDTSNQYESFSVDDMYF